MFVHGDHRKRKLYRGLNGYGMRCRKPWLRMTWIALIMVLAASRNRTQSTGK